MTSENEVKDNVLLKIHPGNFSNFSYSKKSHIRFFRQKNYDHELLDREINLNNCSKSDYQNLLIFSFIRNNFENGAKILEIGNTNSNILELLKNDYECWRINSEALLNDFTLKSENISLENNNPAIKLKNYYSYFDFVFSMSAFDDTDSEISYFNNILFNIYRFLKPGGMSIHNFDLYLNNKTVFHCKLLYYFYRNSFYNFKPVNKLSNLQIIKKDIDLHYITKTNGDMYIVHLLKNLMLRKTKITSYNILLKKDVPSISKSSVKSPSFYLSKYPVYFFHHIIKTGGQALALTFRKWFKIQVDYLDEKNNINEFMKYRYNTYNLVSDMCIVGHFSQEGTYIHQRYPEVIFQNNEFKTFTFLRDPLQIRISLYYYLKNNNLQNNPSTKRLTEAIFSFSNMVSRVLPCDESNYKEVLDRYFFIGIAEYMQESVDKLASILGKKKIEVMVTNESSKDSQVSEITPAIIEKFKRTNYLDYLIYDYCLEKFKSV